MYWGEVSRDTKPALRPDEFWYTAGEASAEIDVLGLADCHYENLAVSGGQLYILDHEVFDRRSRGLAGTFLYDDSASSALGSTSGLMSLAGSRQSVSPHFRFIDGSPRVRYRMRLNVPHAGDLRERYGDLDNYVVAHMDGLSSRYNMVGNLQVADVAEVSSLTRHTFRSTWRYKAVFLLALKEMSFGSPWGDAVRNAAGAALKSDRVPDAVIRSEISQILSGNVPIFWRAAGGNEVIDSNETLVCRGDFAGISLARRLQDAARRDYVRAQSDYVRRCVKARTPPGA